MSDKSSPTSIRRTMLELLGSRDPGKTICPSEVARLLAPQSWRELMEPVRTQAARLSATGAVEVTQRGAVVDLRTVTGPVRLRRGPAWPGTPREQVHWLLPINPAAHPGHLPPDWLTCADATAVWRAIGLTQPIERWCLTTGYRRMRSGDMIWAYLSRRQEICAAGTVAAVERVGTGWTVTVDWDTAATTSLNRHPVSRSAFHQVPMSVCRANPHTVRILQCASYAEL